jgi:chromosomal replication initiation ATPase DnaA
MGKQIDLTELANIVCNVTGVSMEKLLGHEKRSLTDTARGVFFMLSREMGIHPTKASSFVGRSRSSCITTAKQYKGYYDTKDKEVCRIVEKVKSALNDK